MIAGVLTCRGRERELAETLRVVSAAVERVYVYRDENPSGNHSWNMDRCVRRTLAEAAPGEPVLIAVDDVTAPPCWRELWEAMHAEAQADLYALFNTRRRFFTEENLARGWVRLSDRHALYDHALVIIDRPTLVDDAWAWARENPFRFDYWIDHVLNEYLVATGQEWVLATPSIFQHVGGHAVIGTGTQGAAVYVGDRDDLPEPIPRIPGEIWVTS